MPKATPAPSQTGPETIDVRQFDRMPYLTILTYPRPNLKQAKSKIRQLIKLGIDRVTFEGRTKIGRLGLVGIGTVGLVVKGGGNGDEVYALKIRRADANRESMSEEFRLTQLANRVRVGAPVYGCTKDVMSMHYVKGIELEDYVKAANGRGSARRVREMAHSILNQCRKLDLIGLDHGQLSNLRKHVIIDGETPYIIDFESASQNRTTKNVTTAAQFLFIGSSVAPRIKRILSIESSDEILEALKRYKGEMSDENYVRLLATFGVIT
ncbi:MAG: serine/threonine protein kinase [Nitrososphaerales archaeon]